MGEYLTFEKMITPVVIQVIFWIGVVAFVIFGLISLFSGAFLAGLGMIILGPLVIRIECELVILLFRAYDRLHEISANTRKG